jgi:hypothetical protein
VVQVHPRAAGRFAVERREQQPEARRAQGGRWQETRGHLGQQAEDLALEGPDGIEIGPIPHRPDRHAGGRGAGGRPPDRPDHAGPGHGRRQAEPGGGALHLGVPAVLEVEPDPMTVRFEPGLRGKERGPGIGRRRLHEPGVQRGLGEPGQGYEDAVEPGHRAEAGPAGLTQPS